MCTKLSCTKQGKQRSWAWGGNQFVAFFIGLGVILAPLEIPLELWVTEKRGESVTYEESHVSPREYYEAHTDNTQDDVVVFEKGKPTPNVTPEFVTEASDAPLTTTPSPLIAIVDEKIAPVVEGEHAPRKVRIRESAYNNIIAASQVSNGENLSELTSVALDKDANIVAVTDEHGETKRAEYNNEGQPTKIEGPDGITSYFSYDENGNLTGISRTEEAKVTQTGFLGVLARVFPPLFAVALNEETTSLEYANNGIASISNGKSEVSFEYDADGLLSREYRDDGSAVDYYYDELGNVVETVEVPTSGNVLSLRSFFSLSLADVIIPTFTQTAEYNDNNLLAHVALYKDIAPVMELTPVALPIPPAEPENGVTSLLPAETVIATTTQVETTSPSPSPLVPAQAEVPVVETPTTPVAPTVEEVQILPALVTWFTGTGKEILSALKNALSFSYADETNIESPLEEAGTTPTVPPLLSVTYNYDAFGNLTKAETHDGIATVYSYDEQTHALKSKVVTTRSGQSFSYRYTTDNDARVTQTNDETYAYTNALMLSRAGGETYSYDERGNRMETRGEKGAQYTYDGNRLTEATYANGRTTHYTYDKEGRVTESNDSEKGNITFAYTLGGAIETITTPQETIAYAYDGLNRRTSRTSSLTGTVTYMYAGNTLKKVTSEDGTVLREYFYTPKGELIALMQKETLYHAVTDRTRSVVALIETGTGTTYTREYSAWGTITNDSLPHIDIGYLGVFDEPSLGLSILGPRVYDPEIGRFLSKDPLPGVIIDSLSQHEYIYAKNDPVNQYDPSGHESELVDQSPSPKRALVETEKAIAGMQEELTIAKEKITRIKELVSATPDDTELGNALLSAKDELTSLETTLELLKGIRDTQKNSILEAEMSEVIPTPVSDVVPIKTAPLTPEAMPVVPEATSTIVEASTTTLEILPPVVIPTEIVPAVIEETVPVENIPPTTEETVTTPSLPEVVIMSLMGSVAHIAKAFLDDHLKIADAKSKKKKAKVKKEKKKKKAEKKAQEKQKKEAKKLAEIKKQIEKAEKEVARLRGKKLREHQSMIASLTRERDSLLASQKTETALSSIANVTEKGIAGLTQGPTQPTTSSKNQLASAGVSEVRVGSEKSIPNFLEKYLTKETAVMFVSLIPILGEGYDISTLALGKDPITGESLTPIGTAFTVLGLVSGYGSGKLAREGGEKVLREIAEHNKLDYDLVNEAANNVAKDLDLKALAKNGGSAFAELKELVVKEAKVLKTAKLHTTATKIGNGHAFDKHIHEFAGLGIQTKQQFVDHVKAVINNPTKSKDLERGRRAYIDEATETVVVYDPNHNDFGTALIPEDSWNGAINYYNQLK